MSETEIEASRDTTLLKQFAQGDPDAMGRLVSRHGSSVYAFVRRFLGDTGVADDVYQEVWLKVIRNADRFEGRSLFTTWLFQVTRNVCLDHLRDKKRRRSPVSLDHEGQAAKGDEPSLRDQVPDAGPRVPDDAAEREERAAVVRAVASLPEEQREVFLLREQTELTFEEIAKLTSLSPNTVKSRMRYALENLRRALDPRRKSSEGAVARGM